MSLRRHAALLLVEALALACLLLAACEYQVTGYDKQPPLTHDSDATYTFVAVKWVDGVDALRDKCVAVPNRIIEACAHVVRDGKFADTTSCTIYAIKPRDFNDQILLVTLGHEFWHCLGATHTKE